MKTYSLCEESRVIVVVKKCRGNVTVTIKLKEQKAGENKYIEFTPNRLTTRSISTLFNHSVVILNL